MSSWKFWKKDEAADEKNHSTGKTLPKPKELPPMIGRELVVTHGRQPDWVWSLRVAVREKAGEKHAYDFRVFDPNEATLRKVKISDYDALGLYPELILFKGWYNKKTYEVHFIEEHKPQPTSRAA